MKPSPLAARCLAILLIAACGACSALRSTFDGSLDEPSEVRPAIERAQAASENGDSRTALEIARSARRVDGLELALRDELDLLIERFAARRIVELSSPAVAGSKASPKELAQMLELDLPQRLAVDAGVAAARLYLAQGRPYKAYSLLKKVEAKYPRHHGKVEAGEILFDAGMQLADDRSSFLGFFAARDDGIEVLEYLVLTYPLERGCDQAFFKLAGMYEEDRYFEIARERHEELLYAHIKSPLAVASEARIPHLRLEGLESPEYDRRELLKARNELEVWLQRHVGHELEEEVRFDYADCLARLVASDLGIARFYRRIDTPFGARFHAARALEIAAIAANPDLVASASSLLARLPEVTELPGRAAQPGDDAFSTDPSLIRSLQHEAHDKVQAAPPVTPPIPGDQP